MPTDPTDGYRFGYSHDEIERLGDQHRVWEEDNRRLLARAGFGDGATVLEFGCGPGYATLDLARVVGPTGRVIAVDRDGERSLPLLEERAMAAGLDVEICVNTKAVRATTPEWSWPDALFRKHTQALTDENHLTREALDEFLAEWEARSRNPDAIFFSSPVMEVVGRRP